MKKLIFGLAITLGSLTTFAQDKTAQAMEMVKQMQKPKGSITLAIEGKTYSEKSMFIKNPKGDYIISTDLASASNTFTIVLSKKESGTYSFATDKKKQTVFVLQGGNYEVKSGTIKLTNAGGKISGTFKGMAQKFKGKHGNQNPQGNLIPFSGSFSGLTE